MAFYDAANLTLSGSGIPCSTVLRCHDDSSMLFNNVAFFNSSNISINGVTFEECGLIASALYVVGANWFYVNNCLFQHNSGCALLFLNSTNLLVEDSVS